MANDLKIGEKVKMIDCEEAIQYENKVWTTRSEPWMLCGSEVILLEGKSGGFSTAFLERIDKQSIGH